MATSQHSEFNTRRPLRLRNRHQQRLQKFLLRDIDANLFALSWLENHNVQPHHSDHFSYWAFLNARGDLRSVALNVSNRLLMLDANKTEDARAFGVFFRRQDFRFQHVVSRTESVTPFWEVYADPYLPGAPKAKLIQDQQLFRLVPEQFSPSHGGHSRLRLGNITELDAIFLASARMHREETGEDPLQGDVDSFHHHVRHRIQHQRTFVVFDDQRHLLFKADLSTRCSYGAQISGVYTSPRHRNQGIATQSMTDLCALLFEQGLPLLTLYVNETNHAARRVYQKLGFTFSANYQTVFVDD